jgi:shikimate dehydrogenase
MECVQISPINGETRLLAIIGDPISQAKSPIFYNARLAAAGINAVLVPWHAPEQHFETIMQGLMETANLDGIVVTYPFKQRALAFASRLDLMAERIGAVNALRKEADGSWTGGMFDGEGLVQAVHGLGRVIAGSRVKLLGAGGAGSAIAHALANNGAAAVSIYDPRERRLLSLGSELARLYPTCRIETGRASLDHADILVNATPIGLSECDSLPVSLPDLGAKVAVVDIVPRAKTALLRLAEERGCPHVGGAAMVEGQADIVLGFLNMIERKCVPAPSANADSGVA